jgi:squalene-associated FAD-dependent desaturase
MEHALSLHNNDKGKVLVLGAGLAGLSSAAYLVKSGFNVTIFESSGKAGGRAYSFTDKDTDEIIDNGQHILMGCYDYTLRFFDIIGAGSKFNRQDKLTVNFVKPGFNMLPLKAISSLYPVNLLIGLLNYKAITLPERLGLLKVFLKLMFYSSRDLEKLTVDEWLNREEQSGKIKKAFWEIIAVGALNADITKASAALFVYILKQIFIGGNKAASIVLPQLGLSESYCNDALQFIKNSGSTISFYETVTGVKSSGSRITEVQTSKRTIKDFNYVVSALPLYALKRVLPEHNEFSLPELEYSSILTLHIWLKENRLEEKFYGLIDSPVHWVFNHGRYVTLVISSADSLISKSKEDLFDLCSRELELYLNIKKEDVAGYKVIKEKRATFVPSNDVLKKRPGTLTPYNNFFLAGDWTDTKLPATIEGAVKSGKLASDYIINK